MNVDEQLKIISRGSEQIIGLDELKEKIKSGKKLIVKAGFDPSAPDIHLGHTVLLRKMKQFQDLGHTVCLIIGDFTATIGDPTGKNNMRKRLSVEEVLENAKTYQDQAFKILDKNKTKVIPNGTWHNKFNFQDVLNLCSQMTISQMLERDDFNKRYKEGTPISLIEFLYPLVQGYDSVAIDSDVELGGTDQTFNLLVGRDLMRNAGKSPQSVLTMPLLEGLDGVKKMSKSLGNYIGLTDSPKDMFGKTMSLPDNLILRYFILVTDITQAEIDKHQAFLSGGGNPRDVKIELGKTIVRMYHGLEQAEKAHEEFLTIFQKGGLPDEIPEVTLSEKELPLIDLLLKLNGSNSRSHYRRLIEQNAVSIDGEKVTSENQVIELKSDSVVKMGKREFYKIQRG